MHHISPLISLIALGFLLSYMLGMLFQRFKLSALLGYICAGIILGPNFPFFYNADLELANELSELGVTLLMFGVGLHFSFSDLKAVQSIAVPGAIVQIICTMIISSGILYLFDFTFFQSLIFGLCVSVASTVVLLRALNDYSLSSTPRGKIAIGWLVIEDLLTVVVLVVLPTLTFINSETEFDLTSFLYDMLITLAKVSAFLAVMLIFGRRIIPRWVSKAAATDNSELFLLSVLSISLGIAFVAAILFNVSYALGAFFAGMILNTSELSHRAETVTQSLRDAFQILFFVAVGMLFDYHILFKAPILVFITAFIIIVVKSLVAYFYVRIFGKQGTKTAITIAISLAQIGEFSFILAGLAANFGYITSLNRDMILAGAIISIIINPFLFKAIEYIFERVDNGTHERRINQIHKIKESGSYKWYLPTHWLRLSRFLKLQDKSNELYQQEEQELQELELSSQQVEQETDNSSLAEATSQTQPTAPTVEAVEELNDDYIQATSSAIPLSQEEVERMLDGEMVYDFTEIHNHYIVVGYDVAGRNITIKLRDENKPVIVITNNYEEFTELNSTGIQAVFGDFKKESVFDKANVADAQALVFTMTNQVYSIAEAISKLHKKYPASEGHNFKTAAYVFTEDDRQVLQNAGTDNIINIREVISEVTVSIISEGTVKPQCNIG